MVPVQLKEWANSHEPEKNLIYKDGYWNQIRFIRREILCLLTESYEDQEALTENTKVISTHHSKSVELPVFQINLPNGTVFTIRHNFYDWKISVDSTEEIKLDFMRLFDESKEILSVYCEGFPKELVYGPYSKNKRQFTIEIVSEFKVYTFFWIYAHKILGTR